MSFLSEQLADELPPFIKAAIEGDTFFNDVPVVIISPVDNQQSILQKTSALIGKAGMCGVVVFVLPIAAARDAYSEIPDGPLNLEIGLQVWEMLDRKEMATGNPKSAWRIARRCAALLKLRIFNGMVKCLVPATPLIEQAEAPEGVKLRGWHVSFTGLEDDPLVVERVALPMFSPTSGASSTVTITCGTSGAAIYYTLDGTAPSKDAGLLYSGAIDIPSGGATLFAQAYKDDYFPSNLNSAQFTN